jgi:predicted O-linked N-acetylglucosamine transferase (SPINDLY family)
MNSEDLAKYIERTDSMGKSWLLVQLRLKKLAEQKSNLSIDEYTSRLEDIYKDMMNLGEWWVGIEKEVF